MRLIPKLLLITDHFGLAVMFLDAMKRGDERVKKTRRGDEGHPGRMTSVILNVRGLSLRNVPSAVGVADGVAVPRANGSATWACGDRYGGECAGEGEIEKHPQLAQCFPAMIGRLLGQIEDSGEKCVQDCAGENTFDRTLGTTDFTMGLKGVDQAVNFVEALREDVERDDGENKLRNACGMKQEYRPSE